MNKWTRAKTLWYIRHFDDDGHLRDCGAWVLIIACTFAICVLGLLAVSALMEGAMVTP